MTMCPPNEPPPRHNSAPRTRPCAETSLPQKLVWSESYLRVRSTRGRQSISMSHADLVRGTLDESFQQSVCLSVPSSAMGIMLLHLLGWVAPDGPFWINISDMVACDQR